MTTIRIDHTAEPRSAGEPVDPRRAAPGARCEGACSPVHTAHGAQLAPHLAPGAQLTPQLVVGGRYRLKRVLGEGAMGVVWEAEHLELERPVALKVLTQEAARAPDIVARFEREARAACRVDHPNVVRVLDFGRMPDGAPYLVMQKLEGETLEAVLEQKGRLSLGEACAYLKPIAAALDAAHALGVVHRDVKPANVICARTHGGTRVTLVDFGLAALRDTGDRRLTRAGTVLGTPGYLAPEAAGGDRVDHRADIYALACIAFEMLTGRLPHEAPSLMGVLAKKLTEPAPRLSDVIAARFDEPLEAVLARALSMSPQERPKSAGELVRALVRIAEGRVPAPLACEEPPRAPKRATGLWLAAATTLAVTLAFAWAAFSALPDGASANVRAEHHASK